jgi:hypothetical protein
MPTPRRLAPLSLAMFLFVTLVASGCGKKIAAVCEAKCGSTADIQTCTDSSATAESTAEERGCESEFEDYVACLELHATCTKGVLDAANACATETAALTACTK